jgi:hypothetical protein
MVLFELAELKSALQEHLEEIYGRMGGVIVNFPAFAPVAAPAYPQELGKRFHT